VPALWRSPGLGALFTASTTARLANEAARVAVVLLILDRTGSPALAGTVVGALALPALVTGPVLGAWLDRTPHRRSAFVLNQVLLLGVLLALLAVTGTAPSYVVVLLGLLAGLTAPVLTGGFTGSSRRWCRRRTCVGRTARRRPATTWPVSSDRRWPGRSPPSRRRPSRWQRAPGCPRWRWPRAAGAHAATGRRAGAGPAADDRQRTAPAGHRPGAALGDGGDHDLLHRARRPARGLPAAGRRAGPACCCGGALFSAFALGALAGSLAVASRTPRTGPLRLALVGIAGLALAFAALAAAPTLWWPWR
jgi:MFS family permease